MKEVNLPTYAYGVLLSGMTWGINHTMGLSTPLYLTGIAGGLIITAVGLKKPDKVETFYSAVGMDGVKMLSKNNRKYGYDINLSLPTGTDLEDFRKHKQALEQHLNAEVEFQYKDKQVKCMVRNGELKETYPYMVYKTNNPTELVLGYSREGIETLDMQSAVHLLIAGETGSGKSVCLRSIITTLILTKNTHLNLIDFKRVELGIFKKSKKVKRFCKSVEEFDTLLDDLDQESKRRYDLFEQHDLVNIQGYNATYKPLTYIINIIDEFANLEDQKAVLQKLKIRLAMDRACGIHYIVCTQHPSHKILSGELKANIPTRLSFAVGDNKYSEMILDQTGAENLPGNGACILKHKGKIKRLQTMFLSESEARELIKNK